MNKRGDTTIFHELVKAIPAVLLVLILVAAGVKIYNATHPEKYSTEKKDLLRIVAEIKDLKQRDSISIPIFSKEYILKVVRTVDQKEKSAYSGCNMDYCACFFTKDDKLVLCETFNLRDDFGLEKDDYKKVTINSPTPAVTTLPLNIARCGKINIYISNSHFKEEDCKTSEAVIPYH